MRRGHTTRKGKADGSSRSMRACFKRWLSRETTEVFSNTSGLMGLTPRRQSPGMAAALDFFSRQCWWSSS